MRLYRDFIVPIGNIRCVAQPFFDSSSVLLERRIIIDQVQHLRPSLNPYKYIPATAGPISRKTGMLPLSEDYVDLLIL